MNLQFTLAMRYLSGRKLRTILTTLAIVFGVLVIFGMNLILPAFMSAFQANMMAVADKVDATITPLCPARTTTACDSKGQ